MDPVPGNIYGSDFSLMNPTDPFYISQSLLASTSTHTLWPINAVDPDTVPGHLVPGASFSTYPTAYHWQDETFSICDAGDHHDFNTTYQTRHGDWTTQRGSRDINIDECVGQGFPPMTSDFGLDSMGEAVLPFSDFSDLPLLPNNDLGSWREPLPLGSFDPCDALMRDLAVEEHAPWDLLSSLEVGLDGLNIPQSLYDDVASDTTHVCAWRDGNGSPCNMSYPPGDNLKHHIAQHLHQVHHLSPSSGKSALKCLWVGCSKELKLESMVRHIQTVHLHVSMTCKACGNSFARQDSLQRHMRNSCGACKGER